MWSVVFGNPIRNVFEGDFVMVCDLTVTCQALPSSENNDDQEKQYQVCLDFIWYETEEIHKFGDVKKKSLVRN